MFNSQYFEWISSCTSMLMLTRQQVEYVLTKDSLYANSDKIK